jgi:hypothetical protein
MAAPSRFAVVSCPAIAMIHHGDDDVVELEVGVCGDEAERVIAWVGVTI